jgi:predicted ester cyclase
MSERDNVAKIHRLYEQLNNDNLDVVEEIISPDFVAHGETMGLDPNTPDRREAMKKGIRWAKQIFPDLVVTIEDTIAVGDRVVCRLNWVGTQKDPFMGVQPSGKPIAWTAIAINRFENGMLVERWFNSDELGMMQQMGLIPQMGGGEQKPVDETVAAARQLARRYIDAINAKDEAELRAVFTDDFVDHNAIQLEGIPTGVEGVVMAHHMLDSAIPDLHFSLEDIVVEGDTLGMRVNGEGTHNGNLFGIEPTGNFVRWSGHRILKIRDGKFSEGSNQLDQVGIMQQIGVMPPMVMPGEPEDTEANRASIKRLYDGLSTGNLDILDQIFDPLAVIHGDSMAPLSRGPGAYKKIFEPVRAAFPDLKFEVESSVAQDDKIVSSVRWTGTHSNTFMGFIPPSNKQMSWTEMLTDRFEKGKIVERWYNTDALGLFRQLGLAPS